MLEQLFHKAWRFLKDQRLPSCSPNGTCWLRNPDGTRCAIGCLIPDELYHSHMEYLSIPDLGPPLHPRYWALINAVGQPFDLKNDENLMVLLSKMQRAHDNAVRTMFKDEPGSIFCYLTAMNANFEAIRIQYGFSLGNGGMGHN